MKRLMREAGQGYRERSHISNSRLAQELGKWTDTQKENSEILDLIYRAYFVYGRAISDIDELLKIAKTAGFNRKGCGRDSRKTSFRTQCR